MFVRPYRSLPRRRCRKKSWRPLLPITSGIFGSAVLGPKAPQLETHEHFHFIASVDMALLYKSLPPNKDKPGGRWRFAIIYIGYKTENFAQTLLLQAMY